MRNLRQPLIELHDGAVGVFEKRGQYLAARGFTVGSSVGFGWWQQNLDAGGLEFFDPFTQVIDPERKMMQARTDLTLKAGGRSAHPDSATAQ